VAFIADTTGPTVLETGDVTCATVLSTVEATGAVVLETVETTGAAVLLAADVAGAMVFDTVNVTGATVFETGAATGAPALETGATTGATGLLLAVEGELFVVSLFGAVEALGALPGRDTGEATVFEVPPDPATLLVVVDTCGAVAGTETATGAVVFDGAVPVAPDDVDTETRDPPGRPSASALSVSRKSDASTPMTRIGSRRARYRRCLIYVSRPLSGNVPFSTTICSSSHLIYRVMTLYTA
jgi:hypothetical protein